MCQEPQAVGDVDDLDRGLAGHELPADSVQADRRPVDFAGRFVHCSERVSIRERPEELVEAWQRWSEEYGVIEPDTAVGYARTPRPGSY